MAVSVVLEKVSEGEDRVTYRYGPDLSNQGTIQPDPVAQRYVDVQAPVSTSAATEFSAAMKAIARAEPGSRTPRSSHPPVGARR